jgi:hypothetical protein
MILAVALVSTAAFARNPESFKFKQTGSKILGLYDSTDAGSNGRNRILNSRVQPAVRAMGLQLVIHDASSGLPSKKEMEGFRGIITAFNDGDMLEPKKYLTWLKLQLDEGRRLVVLNNFGAYRDRDTKKYVEPDTLNTVLRDLGVRYGARWTSNPSLIELVATNDAMLQKPAENAFSSLEHYYHFAITDRTVRPHVLIRRNDITPSESAVVFTSDQGGMALERYYEDVKGRELINTRAFIEAALFPEARVSNRVLFLIEPESAVGHKVLPQLHWVTTYAKLEADWMRVADASTLNRRDLAEYGVVVYASANADRLGSPAAKAIETWVRDAGGGFVNLFGGYRPEWRAMFGAKSWPKNPQSYKSITFTGAFYPGLEGLNVKDMGDEKKPGPLDVAIIPNVTLTKDTTVLARAHGVKDASATGAPVMWKRRHGTGRVVVRTDSLALLKPWRGSILQSILQTQAVAAAPVVNAMVYYVDDCPQPMWNVVKQPIQGEYGLSDTDFYRTVWWPDLMDMVKQYKLKLTFNLIFSYDDEVKSGFSADPFYSQNGKGVPQWMAMEAVRLGHEIALHGYNHQSLVEGGGYTSKGWETRDRMVASLLEARREWIRLFGENNLPFTYVAPNNHIHRAGKEAVKIAFPEIRVMSAQYLTEGDIEGHEWDADPDVPHFLDMPRVSSEFFMGSSNNVPMHDGVMLAGIWTHFVHPDDVYDPERNNGTGWKGLNRTSRLMLRHMTQAYPWLRPMTARDAYHEIIAWRSSGFQLEHEPNKVTAHLSTGTDRSMWFVLRLDPGRRVTAIENGRVGYQNTELGYWYIEGQGSRTVISLSPVE